MANILFFGSTTDSVIVLEKLFKTYTIAAIVTQPPRPTPTPVDIWGKAQNIAVLSFENNPDKPWLYKDERVVIDTLNAVRADLLVSASYGQKIPTKTLTDSEHGGLNIHPSLLPRWRGGDPVPWAILTGDHQIGVSIVTLSDEFDAGRIIAQKKIPIMPHDTSTPLRTKLFTMGSDMLIDVLPDYIHGKIKGAPQNPKDAPTAKRLSRELGFEPWEKFDTDGERIEKKFRAFTPWPGVWSIFQKKRIKILALHLENDKLIFDTVQLEGKNPVSWKQFQKAYLDTR